MPRRAPALVLLTVASVVTGCQSLQSDPAKASVPYPKSLHEPTSIDVQVIRDDTEITLSNATAQSFADFDLWLNQRYVRHVRALPAGESITLSLWGFHDVRGEPFNAGGFWRTEAATPLWLVEIQTGPESPLVGLITIVTDE